MVRNPLTGECEENTPFASQEFAVNPPIDAPSGAALDPCPFGGCGKSGDGKNSIIINNNGGGGGQCQCCDQKQPIIINNIIPADVMRAALNPTLTHMQAANVPVNAVTMPSIPQAAPQAAPIINVHVPAQAAPQVNLSMPDINPPPINVHVSPAPSGTNSGGGGNNSNGGSSAPTTSTGGNSANGGTTSASSPANTASTGGITRPETDAILKELQEIKSQMPFYDANISPTSPKNTEGVRGSSNAAGCCVPNLYVNVSPRFNQQLQTAQEARRSTNESNGAQAPRETGFYSPQPPSNPQPSVGKGINSTNGMQHRSTCNECDEDDDDIEFFINDRQQKHKNGSLSNHVGSLRNNPQSRCSALPPRPQRTEFL